MYNVLYFEKELTQSELIDLMFLELIREKIIEFQTLVECGIESIGRVVSISPTR